MCQGEEMWHTTGHACVFAVPASETVNGLRMPPRVVQVGSPYGDERQRHLLGHPGGCSPLRKARTAAVLVLTTGDVKQQEHLAGWGGDGSQRGGLPVAPPSQTATSSRCPLPRRGQGCRCSWPTLRGRRRQPCSGAPHRQPPSVQRVIGECGSS